jgi:hypothetical protein
MNIATVRTIFIGATLAIGGLATSPMLHASTVQEWRFKVYLDDQPIGYHTFRLTPQGDGRRTIDINAQFDVKFLFFNAYSYRHANTEQWQQRCLRSLQSSTDDNGKQSGIRGETSGDRFYLDTGAERTALGECVMTFAYWDPAILEADRLLNAQTGEYVGVNVKPLGREQIPVREQAISADRYRLVADKATIDLWYAADSRRWLALQSTTESGRKLRYRID